MKLDKSTVKYVILIFCSSISFLAAIFNLDKVVMVIIKGIDMLMPVILGLILAFIINPLMEVFETKIFGRIHGKKKRKENGGYRGFSILLSYLAAVGTILIVFLIVIPKIRDAFIILSHSLPDMITHAYDWIRTIAADKGVAIDEMPNDAFNWSEMFATLSEKIEFNSVNEIFSGAIGFISSFLGSVFNLVLGIVISIHALINKERIGRFFKRFVLAYTSQNTSARIFKVTEIINESFRSFIIGQLTEAVVLGSLCFIGMTIFRFPFSLAVSAVVALTAIIPVLGAWVGGAVGAVLTLTVSPVKATFFIVFIIILQQLENNLIYSRVVGKSMNLPAILILVAVLIGGKLGGIVGMLLSVPLCSIIYTLIRESMDYRLKIKEE